MVLEKQIEVLEHQITKDELTQHSLKQVIIY